FIHITYSLPSVQLPVHEEASRQLLMNRVHGQNGPSGRFRRIVALVRDRDNLVSESKSEGDLCRAGQKRSNSQRWLNLFLGVVNAGLHKPFGHPTIRYEGRMHVRRESVVACPTVTTIANADASLQLVSKFRVRRNV